MKDQAHFQQAYFYVPLRKQMYFFTILVVLCLFFQPFNAHATEITSAQTGSWTTASTWVGGVVPTTNDSVIIASGHTVTLSSNTNIQGRVIVQLGAYLICSANLNLKNTLTPENMLIYGTVEITVKNGINKAGGSPKITIPSTGVIILSTTTASVGASNWDFQSGSSVILNANGNQQLDPSFFGAGIDSLTLDGSGTKTLGENTTVSQKLLIKGTATLALGGKVLNYGSSAILEYNTSSSRTVSSNEWKTNMSGMAGIIIRNSGVITLNEDKTLTGVYIQVEEGAELANGGFNIASPSAVYLKGGCASAGGKISGSGTLTLGGDVTVNDAGTGTAAAIISCPVALTNSATRTFTVNDDGTTAIDLTVSGIISTSGNLVKAGIGTMNPTALNTYTGTTTVSAGTLRASTNTVVASTNGPFGNHATGLNLNGGTIESNIATFSRPISVTASGSRIDAYGSTRTISSAISATGAFTLSVGGTTVSSAEGQDLTLSGILSNGTGTLSVTKTLTSNATFSNTNTYTGVTSINGGTLSVSTIGNGGVAGNIGQATNAAANLVFGGGTLLYTGSSASTDRAFTLSASTTSTINITNALTISGASASASGALIKTGAGTLTLSGANTFTGSFTLSTGTLNINNATALGNGATFTINAGTVIDNTSGSAISLTGVNPINWNGDFTFTGSASLNLGTGAVSMGASRLMTVSNSTLTFGGAISGSGFSITKAGTGSLTLSGANTFTGGVNLNAGTLNINNASALGAGGTFSIAAGCFINNTSGAAITLSTNNPQNWNGDFTFSGSANLNMGTGAVSLSANRQVTISSSFTVGGVISGSGYSLTKAGSGVLILSGANTYTGGTNLNAGTLTLNNAAALGTGSLNIAAGTSLNNTSGSSITLSTNNSINANGDFSFTGGANLNMGTGNVVLSANRQITVNGSNFTLGGVISGTGFSLTKAGAGTLTLANANTYSGGTNLNAGTLNINNAAALGSTSGTFTIAGGSIDNTSGADITLNNYPLALNGDFTYTGSASRNLNLGTGNAVLSASRQVTVSAGNLTIGGVVSGTGFSFTKAGAGTLTLAGANTFNGGMTLSAGTLNINHASALGNGGTFTVSGGTIDNTSGSAITFGTNYPMNWNGNFAFTGTNSLNMGTGTVTMNASRQLTVNGSTLAVGGVIAGAGFSLTKAGAGTLTLSGANTFTGGVTLNAGVLNINNASALGTSAGTFTYAGGSIDNTSAADITTNNYPLALNADVTYVGSASRNLNLGTGNISLSASRQITVTANTLTIGGVINDNTKSITKSGSGALSFGSSAVTINALTINAGTLTATSSTLSLSGDFTNNGIFNSNYGTVTFTGAAAQAIKGSNAVTFKNLTINKSGLANTLTLNIGSQVDSILNITRGTFDLSNYDMTLGSNLNFTSRVASVTPANISVSYSGTGRFIVQRYIPARRAWRLMTAPLSTTNTIYQSWQNNGVYTPGLGTLVTGTGGGNGLDASGTSSLKKWNSASQSFISVLNTNVAISSGSTGNSDNDGYFIFIRGDRDPSNMGAYTSNSNSTLLSSKGKLQYGAQTFTAANSATGARKFTLIGNPYPSPLNFGSVSKTNLLDRFYSWDPSLNTVGAYVTVQNMGGGVYVSTAPGATNQTEMIQSGQAFFVEGNGTNATASIGIDESHKSTSYVSGLFRPTAPLSDIGLLRTNIALREPDNSLINADANIIAFSESYNPDVDADDAVKFTNTNETFSILKNGNALAIEQRAPVNEKDTVFFSLSKTTKRAYQFQFIPVSLNNHGLIAFLQDSYTNGSTIISMTDTTRYNFEINTDAASQVANRFRIVFQKPNPVPVTFTTVKASQQGSNVSVDWKVDNQVNIVSYEVEKSSDGRNFSKINTTPARNGNGGSYSYGFTDVQPVQGNNFYRIRSIGINGSVQYSQVVKVNIGKGQQSVVIYPNPVQNGIVGLQMNNMPKGNYQVRITNAAGQLVYQQAISHQGGSATETLAAGNMIVKGVYQLELLSPDQSKSTIKLIAE